jgi:hypothetical protein
MLETLAALVAFVYEHQRCGDLDGGREGGYVWRNLSTTMRQWVREVTVVAASPVTGSATM